MPQGFLRAGFEDIRAKQGAVAPTLEVKVVFSLTTSSGFGQPVMVTEGAIPLYITGVVPYLFWREPNDGDWFARSIVVGAIAPGQSLSLLRLGEGTCECNLFFPLSPQLVADIETLRKGRKARFRLSLRVTGYYTRLITTFAPPRTTEHAAVDQASLTGFVGHDEVSVPFQLDNLYVYTGRGENQMDIEVEKSKWAEEVLPVLGYGVWRTYEIPVSAEPTLGKVDEYIEQAAKQFEIGEWKTSLSRSRDAVQTLEPHLKKYGNRVYNDKKGPVEEKFGDLADAFAKLASSMLEFQSKAFSLLSAGSHPEAEGTAVERPDAEFGLTVALACRRYVGARIAEQNKG